MNADPKDAAGEPLNQSRWHHLAIAVERLWLLYQAMRNTTPLGNSNEILAQLAIALRNFARLRPTARQPDSAETYPMTQRQQTGLLMPQAEEKWPA